MYLPWIIGFHSFNPFHAGLQDESAKNFKQNNIISPSQKLQVWLNTEPLKNKFGKIIKLFS